MDDKSIREGLRETERGTMPLRERGAQLTRLAVDMRRKFSGLWSVLGSSELLDDNLSWIVLGRDESITHGPGTYKGCIVHDCPGVSTDNPSGIVETDFFIMVDFVPDSPGRQRKMEVDSEVLGSGEAPEGVQMLFEEDQPWTRETLAEAESWCSEYLPEAQRTFDLFLNAACDPILNPDISERTQAFRDSLLAVA